MSDSKIHAIYKLTVNEMNALKDKGEEALHSEVSVDAAHSRVHSVRAHTSVSQVSEMEHKVK